ncbi:SPOR domain-containing protein [Bacteroidota bacterium]
MKKVLILLIIGSFAFSGCKFINEKILKKGSDTLEVYIYNLEQKLASQEADFQGSLAVVQRESQARIDSIIRYYENELASKGGKYTSAASGTYYLIVGSFTTPAYAETYSAKVAGMGYNTEIVTAGHWNLVAAESYSRLREALDGLNIIRSSVAVNSWIYVAR